MCKNVLHLESHTDAFILMPLDLQKSGFRKDIRLSGVYHLYSFHTVGPI